MEIIGKNVLFFPASKDMHTMPTVFQPCHSARQRERRPWSFPAFDGVAQGPKLTWVESQVAMAGHPESGSGRPTAAEVGSWALVLGTLALR